MKKLLILLIVLAAVFFIILTGKILIYFDNQNKNNEIIQNYEPDFFKYMKLSEKELYYKQIRDAIFPLLLTNKAYLNNKPIKLVRYDDNILTEYIVPEIAMEKADAIIGYGIGPNITFENNSSLIYKKPSYGFDCGTSYDFIKSKITTPLCKFEDECIGTDKFVVEYVIDNKHKINKIPQKSSGKIHTLGQKLEELGLLDKKIYLKMDISGAEYEIIPDIVKYSDNITGISIVIHIRNIQELLKAIKTIKLFEKDFVLICRNPLVEKMEYQPVINLTYINKNLIDKYYMPLNQSNYIKYEYLCPQNKDNICTQNDINKFYVISKFTISPIIVIAEKIKKLFNINYE